LNVVVCGGGLLAVVGIGVESVEGGHEVGVDLCLFGFEVFLLTSYIDKAIRFSVH
jgi:hypothetical protein